MNLISVRVQRDVNQILHYYGSHLQALNVLLVKHWHGFGGMWDRIDSILSFRIHFIYRNTFPQNTKTEDGEINISESILYHFTNVGEFLVIC